MPGSSLRHVMAAAAALTMVVFSTGVQAADTPQAAPSSSPPGRAQSQGKPIEFVIIPGGEFVMGSDSGTLDERPAHKVTVGSFQMSKTEVTVGQYRTFIEATKYVTDGEQAGMIRGLDEKGGWGWQNGFSWRHPGYAQTDEFPVVGLSWDDAVKFCQWIGGRLPTEAEWEYAAGNGPKHTRYSWGNDPPSGKAGNVTDETAKKSFKDWKSFAGYEDGFLYPAPVSSFSPNEFGLYDMTGNVWEWCGDWYDENYYQSSPSKNPRGPDNTEGKLKYKVMRGGAWESTPDDYPVPNRVKWHPKMPTNLIGFRVVKDLP